MQRGDPARPRGGARDAASRDAADSHLLALKDTFPDKVYLGEINPQYYAFLAALKAQCDYLQQNVYEKQRENITTSIEWKKNDGGIIGTTS